MTKLYMLDTNTASALIRGNEQVLAKLVAHKPAQVCISSIVAGELHYGIAKKPEAKRLAEFVRAFLETVQTLPFAAVDAAYYGKFRARVSASGLALSSLDMLIAAHARSVGAILVSNDKAFQHILLEDTEDWITSSWLV